MLSKLRESMMYKKLISILNFDDDTGTIRCTSYDDVAINLEKVIKAGIIIQIRNAHIKPANKCFNPTGNGYEIEITENTIIREVTDNSPSDVNKQHNIAYLQLSDIDEVSTSDAYNVIGIVKKVEKPMNISTKADKILLKQKVVLIDEFKNKAIVTAWRDLAAGLTWEQRDVVNLKGVGLNSYNGMRNIKL